MADLSLLQDSQEDTDGLLDFVSQDEMLTPLGRLDKYISSENIFNRQMVARSLLDTLRAVSEDERDCVSVLEQIDRLADDPEPTVRAELMEQIPHIAIFCQEHRPSIPFAFSKYLLPIVVRYLSDQNNLVRKTSQAALLVLLEQELMERGDVESLVCPVLVDLTAPDSSDDVKTEAMAIICKMAPMVGKDVTERLFLPRFCEMCCDCRMFHVRKVCAANFGDMCSVVGGEATEELLLPRFFQLCSDNVWGVRKACAECFMSVSSASSPEVRRTRLSSLFISLISDPSRWVRQAAFQSLGPFISTFAGPCSSSGQFFRDEEQSGSQTHSTDAETVCPPQEQDESLTADDSQKCLPSSSSSSEEEEEEEEEIPEQELFNSFHFWRTPIPRLDPELELEEDRRPPAPPLDRKHLQELIENLEPHIDDPDVKAQVDVLTAALRATALDSGLEDAFLEPQAARSNPFSSQQPSEHLSADIQRRVTRDDDDSDGSDCCLNPEDERKSKQQWKVRRTLAFSIHELAMILGDQLTAAHLVPIFNSFLKDLDEVRIGVLKHLYDFLKLLHQDTRRKYLYQLQEFLVTDNSRNWRFRSELAEQLVLLLELYSAQDVHDYLRPLALCLCSDRVSSVRWTSYRLVSEIIRKLSSCSSLLVSFLGELVEKFCHSQKWSGRQAFAFVCQLSIEEECLSLDQFSEHLLPPLLQLASDPVPNVRVLLAKTLRQTLLEREYFVSSVNGQQEALEHTLVSLQTDVDKDVKYFASVHPSSTRLNEDAMSTTSSTY
ncbi:serine/threonine-protein phosphatase 4 regulatory subunit 1 isoform X2 [Carassius auratus]|uniref:Serine/threonine-protein phosphatase 4 regulatory subunit 1 isoform X2 n=1 Tax=Carassius auratus TaxID=7957 RepID=A0A6P6MM11_CARAU|nr:serine/threonine-protein phosphatase 4 regulatory subunit 1-like isoform X2 [Carassius auratus]